MGRGRAYDEDKVLSGAMHAFRRSGYAGASIRELEAATGLKLGSIYNSYGDKLGLFNAAFVHYLRRVLGRRIEVHAPPAAGLAGLRALFLSLLHEPDGGSSGCLITNAAVEFGAASMPPHGVTNGLRILSDVFADRLAAARRTGALRRDIDIRVAACRLLALYQGTLVLVRAGHDKAALRRLIRGEFDMLERKSR